MNQHDLAIKILTNLPYEPNEQQMQVALALARFCIPQPGPSADRVFVLNGYAGTGKTSLTGALVKALRASHIETVLLAPTGRAAKVFGSYAGMAASTIHRRIYRHSLTGNAGHPGMRENRSSHTVFIVDEASMIGNDDEQGSFLLRDLIQYVFSGTDCRLIMLGDTAQLPPVGSTMSPAMDPDTLRSYGLKVTRATITDVARQAADSGILRNATRLRRAQSLPQTDSPMPVPVVTDGYDDVALVTPDELPDMIDSAYRSDGPGETVVITRSNLTATQFNQAIRSIVLDREEELVPGDLFVAAKNNYYWTRRKKEIDFIANGEVLELRSVIASESRYGLRFADVTMGLPERDDVEFDTKIILDCLTGSAAALDRDNYNRLYQGIYEDPQIMPPGAPHEQRIKLLRESPYWNALQVKYAYAVTCHKAQGGQWRNVFVDLSYVPPEQMGREFFRWLYTAVTRARSRLYLINPPDAMLE
ncbi:MAG: AAA family ATPase [Bacteroidales bacterium]|nr:AAA family ATPase [Bacteroidales bacterium]